MSAGQGSRVVPFYRILGDHVPVALPSIFGFAKSPSVLSGKNTHDDRQIVSSFTTEAILLKVIFLVLFLVLGFAEAKNTAVGAIGKTIRHAGSSSGIPHG